MYSLYQACWLLAVQISVPPGSKTEATTEAATEATKTDPGFFGSILTFLPMMLAVLVIYFLFMQKPGQKENARTKELLGDLKKNDRIVTAGGIMGTVVSVKGESDHLTIRIDENTNTKMQVLKQSIIRVLKDDDKGEVSN